MGTDLVPKKGLGTSSTAWGWVASHPQTLHKPMNSEKTPDSNFPLVRITVPGVRDLGWKSMKAQGFLCWGACLEEAPALTMR